MSPPHRVSLRRGRGREGSRRPKGSGAARGTLTGAGSRDGGTNPAPGASPRLEGTIPELKRSVRTADGRKAQGEIPVVAGIT